MPLVNIRSFITVSTLFTSLIPVTQACLQLYGGVTAGSTVGGSLTAVDNSVQTCSGNIASGDKNLDCISGYSLNYDYSDNAREGPLPITYCNPSDCYGIEIPLECTESCCFEGLSCECYLCTFSYDIFGC